MAQSAIILVLLSLTTLPEVFAACNETSCAEACYSAGSPCSPFDCDDMTTKKCSQHCIGTATQCKTLTCSQKQEACDQTCLNCPTTTKLVCSSKKCDQTCDGKACHMTCTKDVESCKQTCSPNSTCTMICEDGSNCMRSCADSAKCTYPASQPPTPSPIMSACVGDHCVVRCESPNCVNKTLGCTGETTKTCGLLCKDGCKMECGETLDKCTMNCTGVVTNCKTTCKAKACFVYHNGKLIKSPTSAAGILVHIFGNYGMVVLEILLMFVATKL